MRPIQITLHFQNRISLFWYCLIGVALISCKKKPAPNSTDKWFEGRIVYHYTYHSDSLDADSLALWKPHSGMMLFEKDNYKSVFWGKDTLTYLYLAELNKGYSYKGSGRDEQCEDYSQPTDSILSFHIYPTDDKILGYPCKVLEYQSKYFWNRYFVSTAHRLSPGSYQNHRAYNWSFYGEKTGGGIILKMEHRFGRYTMKGIALEVDTSRAMPGNRIDYDKKRVAQICGQ